MAIQCPECSEELKSSGSTYACETCGVKYKIQFTCQECGAKPLELASCGTVGYFCETCNRQRSRSSMNKVFEPITG